jgi:hypothetical protein
MVKVGKYTNSVGDFGSSKVSSVSRKSKASRALSIDTLMLEDRELLRNCFCNKEYTSENEDENHSF